MVASRHLIYVVTTGLTGALWLVGCATDHHVNHSARSAQSSEILASGDAWRGQMLFYSNEVTACAACHTVNGRGAQIGPDLTDVRLRLTVEQLVESIRKPNQRIAEGYQIVMVATQDEIVFGRLVSRNADGLHLGMADDVTIEFAHGDIEETRMLPTLMPAYTSELLSDEDVCDLVAFLLEPGIAAPPTAVAGREQETTPIGTDGTLASLE